MGWLRLKEVNEEFNRIIRNEEDFSISEIVGHCFKHGIFQSGSSRNDSDDLVRDRIEMAVEIIVNLYREAYDDLRHQIPILELVNEIDSGLIETWDREPDLEGILEDVHEVRWKLTSDWQTTPDELPILEGIEL